MDNKSYFTRMLDYYYFCKIALKAPSEGDDEYFFSYCLPWSAIIDNLANRFGG
ncbi:MAG: hypothetical protein ABIJ91_00285 [Candidatus Kuenenbacteria bacterium]